MNENSRTSYFLAAPVLASITGQMFDIGGISSTRSNQKHHQLTSAYIKRQNNRVISLLKVLDAHISLSVTSMPLTNTVTG